MELGELANEWRGFKFWSNNQEPNTYQFEELNEHEIREWNPLIEEYVDCLHFILSIGLEKGEISGKSVDSFNYWPFVIESLSITQTLSSLIADFRVLEFDDEDEIYVRLFCEFIGLGERLGFTWEQIEQAYKSKNQINHERQNNGY